MAPSGSSLLSSLGSAKEAAPRLHGLAVLRQQLRARRRGQQRAAFAVAPNASLAPHRRRCLSHSAMLMLRSLRFHLQQGLI